MQATAPRAQGSSSRPPTEKMTQFVVDLLKQVAQYDRVKALEIWEANRQKQLLDGWTFGFVRNQINELLALKEELKEAAASEAAAKTVASIPTGRYAVDSSTEGQDTAFYRVVNQNGHFRVWIYASNAQHQVSGPGAKSVLKAIEEAGVEEARTRFGVEMGYCWKCGLPLTDKESRDLGIGPVCIKKV